MIESLRTTAILHENIEDRHTVFAFNKLMCPKKHVQFSITARDMATIL